MKLDMMLLIGLVVNTIFAVLWPGQIFGTDPLGLSGNIDPQLENYYTVNGTGAIAYNPATGEIGRNDNLFTDVEGAVSSTDGDAGVYTTQVFGFVDWVKIGWGLIKSVFMFFLGFLFMLWQLVYPLNLLIGIPFSLMYMFALTSFMLGRA